MAFPITPSFRNTTIPPQPSAEWPGFETLPGARALPSRQLALSLLAAPKSSETVLLSWAPKGQRFHSRFSLPNVARVDKSLCHHPAGTEQGRLTGSPWVCALPSG